MENFPTFRNKFRAVIKETLRPFRSNRYWATTPEPDGGLSTATAKQNQQERQDESQLPHVDGERQHRQSELSLDQSNTDNELERPTSSDSQSNTWAFERSVEADSTLIDSIIGLDRQTAPSWHSTPGKKAVHFAQGMCSGGIDVYEG
jgi:hypothetical protein